MVALLVKDWIVSRNLLIFSFLLLITVFLVVFNGQLPLLFGLVLSLFNMRNIDGLEDENEHKILIQSMPVSRLEVVVSKIIFHLLQVGINLFVIVLLNGLLSNLKANSPREIFLTTILAIILILGYQFLYTFFGPVFMNYITVIFFLLFILFGWTIARSSFIKGVIEWVLSIDQTILFIMLSLICLVLSTLILFVTVKVYEHKDFN